MTWEYGMDLVYSFCLLLVVIFCGCYSHKYREIFANSVHFYLAELSGDKEQEKKLITHSFLLRATPAILLCIGYVFVGSYRLILFLNHFKALNIATYLLVTAVSVVSLYFLVKAVSIKIFLRIKQIKKHGATNHVTH